jgi:energy-coupling factor transport system permease protein
MATVATRLSRRQTLAHRRLPRALHPVAWWLWALGLAVAASRTTNPLLLGAVIGVATWVVMARRSDAPWAKAFRLYVLAGVLVIAIRVFFRILFAGGEGTTVLIPLPEIELPVSGISLLGDITAESLLGGFYDGLRLATMLICLGAANALANPRRLLRSMPPALHEVSTAVVVALSVFPQLAESFVRVRRARRLRPAPAGGRRSKLRGLRSLVIPVLEDALDRSLLLAASMDSRGYGRSGDRTSARSRLIGLLMVVGLGGVCVGAYGLLDSATPRVLSMPLLVAGVVVGIAGLALSSTGVRRTAYRPDHWRLAELVVVCSGIASAVVLIACTHVAPETLDPTLFPLVWPQLAPLPLAGVLIGVIPAFAAPEPVMVESGIREDAVAEASA